MLLCLTCPSSADSSLETSDLRGVISRITYSPAFCCTAILAGAVKVYWAVLALVNKNDFTFAVAAGITSFYIRYIEEAEDNGGNSQHVKVELEKLLEERQKVWFRHTIWVY